MCDMQTPCQFLTRGCTQVSGIRLSPPSPHASLAEICLLTLQAREHEANDRAREVHALQVGAPPMLMTLQLFTSRWCPNPDFWKQGVSDVYLCHAMTCMLITTISEHSSCLCRGNCS